ncbi:AraC-type DNA-binding protein [Mucilaginibacter mallensis]|uniref:AraC-type DNA-binding protein n=1 Tax=Mucilaginibacter mallensis TaxID=652787 RepID=A0A1H1WA40_MUCMA|nr:AraC family transcriptional regulator [Mucilaginibacter mallensis]SDS93296.1 AraC-type DNA-binding protein [Mucilaginibacter mallensis]
MKEDKSHIVLDNILYSCVDQKQRGSEQFVHEHALGYVISGETHLITNDGVKIFKAGSIGLVRRNQLLKSIKVPPPGGEFKSLNIFLNQNFLRRYSTEHKIDPVGKYTGEYMRILSPDPFLKGYFDSLIPYFDHHEQLKSSLGELKTNEAIELLLRHDKNLKDFLFDFSEPYKINLEAYMNQNYMYNVPAAQFARLTGRSLASFKRDFEKIFNASPGQWLQQKRLSEAYYQISEKGRKPSDVYLDVGFENLSHFSYTFKKVFGVAPSML